MADAAGLPPVLDELTKKTIDLLGRVVKKPPLTQKLLAKPPFRYLHDIFSELVRSAPAFAAGLYSDAEMNSDSVKDKDAKIAYLTKMIDCIGLATNIEIRANPLKIVAGLDAEETNAFLQLIAKVILKKVDTTDAVARVLAGEHQGKKAAPAPAAAADPPSVPTPASAAPAKPAAAAETAPVVNNQPSKPTQPQQAAQSAEPLRKEKSASNLAAAQPHPHPSQPKAPAAASSSTTSGLPPKPSTAASKDTAGAGKAHASSSHPHNPSTKDTHKVAKPHASAEIGNTDTVAESPSIADAHAGEDNPSDPRVPQPVVKRRERPISARPPPPKRRPAEVAAEETPSIVPTIIADSRKDEEDDDEFVVRAVQALKNDSAAGVGPGLDEKHGGLVQKILQTKKDLEGDATANAADTDTKPGATSVYRDGKSIGINALKEIEALRDSIQALCQSTNPLGKTMDYMQEDVDSMNKELEYWRKESLVFKKRLEEETKTTHESLVPLEEQLKVIEESIEEQLEKISAAKAIIIEGDASIQKLLRGITTASK